MNCQNCNNPQTTCNKCNEKHYACHPCYNSAVQTCNNTEYTATPIPECVTPDYCPDGCHTVMESDCINTVCGTLTEALNLLIDPLTCLPLYTSGESTECTPLGSPGTYTTCIEDAFDVKASFLADNASIDATGVISFVSGPQVVTEFTGTLPQVGTYQFVYTVFTTCLEAQLITLTVNNCNEITLTLTGETCVNGNVAIAGTYTPTTVTPSLVVTTGQEIINSNIASGNVSFDVVNVQSSQLVSFYIEDIVPSNTVTVAIQGCEECMLDIEEEQGGCLNELSVVSETEEFFEEVDIELITDSIVFNTNWKCVLDVCGTATSSSSTQTNKLETHIGLDYSEFIDGVSYIKQITLESNNTGTIIIPLDPISTGNSNLYFSSSFLSTWQAAVQTQITTVLTGLGYTAGTDYLYFQYNSSSQTTFHLNFRIKHNPAGNWLGFVPGNVGLGYVISGLSVRRVTADFLNTDFSILCTDTDACGNSLSANYTVLLDNVDFTQTTYDNIVLLSTTSNVVPITTNQNQSWCALEINLTANFSGCEPVTYLWSNGATTQTITNVAAGNYTVTATCSDCTEVDSYEIVSSIDCTDVPSITYDCSKITCSTTFDTITVSNGIGVVTNQQVVYLPDGQYTATFSKTGCPDKIKTFVVHCTAYWTITPGVIYGTQVCETTFNVNPVIQGSSYSVQFVNTSVPDLSITYTTADVGRIYSYDENYSLELSSITPQGVVTFKTFAVSNQAYVIDVIDYGVTPVQSVVNTFSLCL